MERGIVCYTVMQQKKRETRRDRSTSEQVRVSGSRKPLLVERSWIGNRRGLMQRGRLQATQAQVQACGSRDMGRGTMEDGAKVQADAAKRLSMEQVHKLDALAVGITPCIIAWVQWCSAADGQEKW